MGKTATEKSTAPEYLLVGNFIIPVANISYIVKPDDTVHVWLKNNQELRFKMDEEEWKTIQGLFVTAGL